MSDFAPNVAYWWPRDVLSVTGADTDKYLQGQVSQDVGALAPGMAAWSFVLEPTGKVAAWFRITRRAENSIVIDVDAGFSEVLVARLKRFLLRVDVTIETLPWRCLSVKSTQPVAHELLESAELGVAVDWPDFVGVDLLGPNLDEAAVVAAGLDLIDAPAFAARRIGAAFPAMGSELTESTIPNEAGIVDVSASFTKGCYTGQELVARVDSRGNNTPRKLHRVVVATTQPVLAGSPILVDGAVAGTVTSAATAGDQTVALAYIKRSVNAPVTGTVQIDDAAVAAEITPLGSVGDESTPAPRPARRGLL